MGIVAATIPLINSLCILRAWVATSVAVMPCLPFNAPFPVRTLPSPSFLLTLFLFVWAAQSPPGVACEAPADLPLEIRAAAGAVLTLSGGSGNARSVTHFVAAEGSRIILVGKRGEKFLVNVSGDFEVKGAAVILQGGLLPADVSINLMSGSSSVRRRIAEESLFFGCIFANGVPVTISNSILNGRKVAGPIERNSVIPLLPPPRPRGPVGP